MKTADLWRIATLATLLGLGLDVGAAPDPITLTKHQLADVSRQISAAQERLKEPDITAAQKTQIEKDIKSLEKQRKDAENKLRDQYKAANAAAEKAKPKGTQ